MRVSPPLQELLRVTARLSDMPAYTFEALNPQGRTEQGVVEADSERAARSQLRTQGLLPLNLLRRGRAPSPCRATSCCGSARVFGRTDLVVWTRQLASLVAAGLPLERAHSPP